MILDGMERRRYARRGRPPPAGRDDPAASERPAGPRTGGAFDAGTRTLRVALSAGPLHLDREHAEAFLLRRVDVPDDGEQIGPALAQFPADRAGVFVLEHVLE